MPFHPLFVSTPVQVLQESNGVSKEPNSEDESTAPLMKIFPTSDDVDNRGTNGNEHSRIGIEAHL